MKLRMTDFLNFRAVIPRSQTMSWTPRGWFWRVFVYQHSRVTISSNKKISGWETVTKLQLFGPTHVLHMDLLWLSFYSLQIHCSNLTAWCSSGCPYHEWRDLWAHTSHHHSRFSCPTDCFHLYANKMEEVAELPAGHFGIHKHHPSSVD